MSSLITISRQKAFISPTMGFSHGHPYGRLCSSNPYGLARRASTHLDFYRRLIDDTFLIWSGCLSELDSFLYQLNNLAPTIKLTWNISKEKAFSGIWSFARTNMSPRNSSLGLIKNLSTDTCISLLIHIILVILREASLKLNSSDM